MKTDPEEIKAASGSQTVARAIQVLRLVACGQELGVRLTDLVQMSGLNRPTVHRILKTLQAEGAVEQDALSRRYRIGPEITLLGIARTRRFPLMSVAGTSLVQLAQSVGDTAFISIRHGLDSICIGRQTGHHPIQVLSIDVGARRPLGVGVSGVALLSCLSEDEAAALTLANNKRLAFHGLTVDALSERIIDARRTGYAYTSVGVMSRTRAVAVPVLSDAGEPLAALTITAMAERLTAERLPSVVQIMQGQAQSIGHQYSEQSRLSQGC
ncbi:IclR family transcriptional regulator [Pusillimonas sp. SM2304]|uniref:IclR family transcriptional regulator n=1 Tax=Pusillimonas sp. SM2304 TaxID=3073241 RepID=UPI002875DB6D|nr:IclR family transcriptional regulator [Pusillimonas sp. SM2304]MDS1140174.1 IclR family transcriptional regulator [Pusillimonas sp. SM2304]